MDLYSSIEWGGETSGVAGGAGVREEVKRYEGVAAPSPCADPEFFYGRQCAKIFGTLETFKFCCLQTISDKK